MAASLNTFAAVMLAFPFYLAQKGKLTTYVNLAKPSTSTTTQANTTTGTANPTATSTTHPTANAPAGGSSTSNADTAQNVASAFSSFSDAMALFT